MFYLPPVSQERLNKITCANEQLTCTCMAAQARILEHWLEMPRAALGLQPTLSLATGPLPWGSHQLFYGQQRGRRHPT